MLQTTTASGLAVLGGAPVPASWAQESAARRKRVLAILGDAYHATAPLDGVLVGRLRKNGWEAMTIMDYNAPFDDFSKFDLIIMSREGHEYVQFFRDRERNPQPRGGEFQRWLTPAQEQKFEDYVKAGGRLFLYHDGVGFYAKDGGIGRVSKAYFIRHPAIVSIQVTPTDKMPELTRGVTPFTVADEEYVLEMDESQTSVFMESHSPEHGRAPQGWAHTYGQGKVAVFVPGHSTQTQQHPMVQRVIQNCIEWLLK
jgi:hypothetical protein